MAEAVGIGICLLSFSIQVGDSLMKLKKFADSMKNASDDLQRLIRRIERVMTILNDLDHQGAIFDRDGTGIFDALHTKDCREAASRLAKIVKEIEKVLVGRNKRGRLKYALCKKNIEDFERQLDCEISTLELFFLNETRQSLQQLPTSREVRQLHQDLVLNIDTKMEGLSDSIAKCIVQTISQQMISAEIHAALTGDSQTIPKRHAVRTGGQTHPSTLGSLFGALSYDKSRKPQSSVNNPAQHVTLRISVPSWLGGKVYEAQKLQQSWTCNVTFRSYNVVPPEARLFQYSRSGDVQGLQQLFASGQATPFDRDTSGNTALHYAGNARKLLACRFLVGQGADCLARNQDFRVPLEDTIYPSNSEHAMEFVRLYRPSDLEEICMQVLLFDDSQWDYSDTWYEAIAKNPSMLKLVLQHACKPFQDLPFKIHAELAEILNNYDFDPETIRIALAGISRQNDMILKRNDSQVMWSSFLALSCPRYATRSRDVDLWTEILAKAIRAGIDLNGYFSQDVPETWLCTVVHPHTWRGVRKSMLRRLVQGLAATGVDLLAFGKGEMNVLGKSDNPFDEHDWKAACRWPGVRDYTVGLRYGATPEEWDFWHVEAVYYEYAEDFWHMIESPWERMPGAWNGFD